MTSAVKANNAQLFDEAVRLFWTVADGYVKRRLLIALGLVGVASILVGLTPVPLKLAIDALSEGSAGRQLLWPAGLILLHVLGQYLSKVLTELRTLTHGQAEQRARRHIGERLFDHLVRLPLRFHLSRKAGAMGDTAEQGIRGYELLIQHLVYTILPVSVELTMVAAVLIYLGHATYLIILGLASIAYVLAFYYGATSVQEPVRAGVAAHIESQAHLTDCLINAETVKYFDAEPVVSRRYSVTLKATEAAWRRYFHFSTVNGIVIATIFAASLGATLLYAAHDVVRGTMSVGDFVLVNAYVVRLVTPLESLGYAVRDIAKGLAFLDKLLELLREKPEGNIHPQNSGLFDARGELRFERVNFSYQEAGVASRPILKDVSFFVPAGRTAAIVGVSGSGKSSLIRMLFRLYEPDSGEIYLDGAPIADLPLSTVRQAIAVVPQDTVLFHDSLRANIAFGKVGATQEEIEEAATAANLHQFIMSLPEGYDTVVGERGLKLSGGERQRVAIARAALKKPRIFVFDEATSSLDSHTEREILRNLADVARTSTTLVIAHRLSTVVHADEILMLQHGVIVERGTHRELLERNDAYAALWYAQHADTARTSMNTPGRDPRNPQTSIVATDFHST